MLEHMREENKEIKRLLHRLLVRSTQEEQGICLPENINLPVSSVEEMDALDETLLDQTKMMPMTQKYYKRKKKKSFILLTCVLSFHVQGAQAVSADDIVRVAKSHIYSTSWSFSAYHSVGSTNSNKCNLFVGDVLKAVGANAPNRRRWFYSPIGANEWGNPSSRYLIGSGRWQRCSGNPMPGDVIAGGGHVGIVTGFNLTTSATYDKIVENDWGFRHDQTVVCWRYRY